MAGGGRPWGGHGGLTPGGRDLASRGRAFKFVLRRITGEFWEEKRDGLTCLLEDVLVGDRGGRREVPWGPGQWHGGR